MPRNISFMLTTEQFKNRTKTVTRRLGWKFLKAGDVLMGCEKVQGIKKGELNRLGLIRVVSVRRELLGQITDSDVVKEGFPDMDNYSFVDFFIKEMKPHKGASTPVTRVEFEYI
jgi:hypothetical protein